MRTAIDVVLAKPEPTRDELVSMAAEVRQAVDHSERLIEALLVLARNDQARTLTDPLDLAAVAEDALEGRTANGITTTTTLDEAPVTGDGVLLERLVANLLDNAERYNIAGGTVTISTGTDNGDVRGASRQHRPGRTTRSGRPAVPAVHPARRPHPPRRLRTRSHPRLIDRRGARRHRRRNRHAHRWPRHQRPPPATRERRRTIAAARLRSLTRVALRAPAESHGGSRDALISWSGRERGSGMRVAGRRSSNKFVDHERSNHMMGTPHMTIARPGSPYRPVADTPAVTRSGG